MTATIHGSSRATSALASRAGSAARDIAKRRAKPYKTEKRILQQPKRKLHLCVSSAQPPRGYTLLPVGTPDLAERCKELSRQQGFAVNVVNAKPTSKQAADPSKLSHHVHRIGYHFKAEIVEEACAQLGYTVHRGQFVKEADLREQHQRNIYAQTLARYGVRPDVLGQQQQRETPDQVRAAIKELFPRIPDNDLDEIVRRAWEEDTKRVGNNKELNLPRRVQLATIARIRHTYTDYDQLLRAFDWATARQSVEAECLKKLIEWRGENDPDESNDNQFEDIVRETIVIDSDDDGDAAGHASEADDEDSVTELDMGHASDASIEILQHAPDETDFGAESVDERSTRVINRNRPPRRGVELRNQIARQKIGAVRDMMRRAGPEVANPLMSRPLPPSTSQSWAQVPPHQDGQTPDEVIINGQRLRVVPINDPRPDPRTVQYVHTPQNGSYGSPVSRQHANYASSASQPHPQVLRTVRQVDHAAHDRPVASIELEDVRQPAVIPVSSGPAIPPMTPDSGRGQKRRKVDYAPTATHSGPDNYRPMYADRRVVSSEGRATAAVPAGAEVMDLTSPNRAGHGTFSSPYALDGSTERPVHGSVPRPGPRSLPQQPPPPPQRAYPLVPEPMYRPIADKETPYDPSQPLLQVPARDPQPVVRYVQPIQEQGYVQQYTQPSNGAPAPTQYYQQEPAARIVYQQAYPPYPPQRVYQLPPQPVHGAPAPVQQVPREYRPQYVPADGAVAPTQYYYPPPAG